MAETETEADATKGDGAAPPEGEGQPKAESPDAPSSEPEAKAEEKPEAEEKAEAGEKAEAKAEPKSKGLSPAKQVVAKSKPTEPQRDTDEQPKSAQEIFQENLPVILVVGLLIAGVVVWWSYDQSGRSARSDAAWAALARLERDQPEGSEGFAELTRDHRDTAADPFIQIAWASRLYASGERVKVEQARDILERIQREHPESPLLGKLVSEQLDKIKAELADPNVPWPAAQEAGPEDDLEDGAGLPPGLPPLPGEAPAKAPGEDEHAGHDHGDEDEHDAAEEPADDGSAGDQGAE